MNKELITKKDYEILGINENAKPKEINLAYEKLILEYHPEKIKLAKLREPNEFEVKKYKEIEHAYKKIDLEFDLKHAKYICGGWKGKDGWCKNEFYPCLWKKVEEGHEKLFCSQECYNSKYESPTDELIEKWKKEDEQWRKQNLEKTKKQLENWKRSYILEIYNLLSEYQVKVEDLEPNNRNYEQEINAVTIKDHEDEDWFSKIIDIKDRITKDIFSKNSKKNLRTCDYCQKQIKGDISYGAVGKDGHKTFCSEECREKGMEGKWITVARKNVFVELLKWMKKEGISGFSLEPNSKKLVVKYDNGQEKIIEDDNLTSEQKEIKEFFKQTGKNHLSQNQVREEIEKESKGNDNNKWLGPAIGFGIIALIIVFVGIIIYRNKKRNY